MIELSFTVNGQELKRTDSQLVATNSAEYHKAKFTFSEHWNGTEKTAVFSKGGKNYVVLLDNDNSCTVPFEVMQGDRDSAFSVSLFGNGNDSIITSSVINIQVVKGCMTSGAIPEFTPDLYTQLMSKIEAIEASELKPADVVTIVEEVLATKNFISYSD